MIELTESVDEVATHASGAARAVTPSLRRVTRLVGISAVILLLAVAALFFVEGRANDWDPQYARDIVERTMRFGGSYYENSVHNKGPLEPGVYHLAATLSTFDTFWFAISVMVIGVSLLLGFTARRVVTLFGGDPWLGWVAVPIVFIHLALSGADYAGVLYSRNMTVALLCGAFLLFTGPSVASGRPGRRWLAVVAGGALVGLAVQTLQTTILSGAVVVLVGLCAVGRSTMTVPEGGRGAATRWISTRWPLTRWQRRGISARALLVGAVVFSFLSAPVWYVLRGAWRPFWDGWWVYGRYMSSALGRSLVEQVGLGWHQFYIYSQAHAPAHLCVVGFLLMGVLRWRQMSRVQRQLHVLLPLWWAAGWAELLLTQRYSSHYFVVTSVPLILICAGLAGQVVTVLRLSGARTAKRHLLPYLLLAFTLVWSGFGPLRSGVEAASNFRGVDRKAFQREQGRDGASRAMQAVLDLVSRPDDPILTWTNHPWPFLDFRRVSATRFIWKAFLMGEVYLGPTSTDYVLPGSWDLWAADVRTSRPRAFLTDDVFPVPSDTPAGALLESDFEEMFVTPTYSLALLDSVADELRSRERDEAPQLNPLDGWSVSGSTVRYQATDETTWLHLGDLECRRFDAVWASGGGLSFHFANAVGVTEDLQITLSAGRAVTRSSNVIFTNLPAPVGDSRTVSLLVGRSVAVVLVDGTIVGALNLLSTTRVSLSSVGDSLELDDVGAGASPSGGQC